MVAKQNEGELLKNKRPSFNAVSLCMGPHFGALLWMWQLFVYFEGKS